VHRLLSISWTPNLDVCQAHLGYILKFLEAGIVVHAYNLSTQKVKAGGWQVQGQSGLDSETLSQQKPKYVNI
jgi:hypothetical protein